MSSKWFFIQYVGFAAVALVAGLFVDAHHLNKEHETVALGLHEVNPDQAASEPLELNPRLIERPVEAES